MTQYPYVMGFDLADSGDDVPKRQAVLDAAASLNLRVKLGERPLIAVTIASPQQAYAFGQRTTEKFRELMTPRVVEGLN